MTSLVKWLLKELWTQQNTLRKMSHQSRKFNHFSLKLSKFKYKNKRNKFEIQIHTSVRLSTSELSVQFGIRTGLTREKLKRILIHLRSQRRSGENTTLT